MAAGRDIFPCVGLVVSGGTVTLAGIESGRGVLRSFDDRGAQQIWVELPPAGAEWDGVRDRLVRAAA